MNKKIEKVCAEIDKTKTKISEYNARLRELEKQKTELENTEIVELVRGVEASPAELAAFIKAFRETLAASFEEFIRGLVNSKDFES